MFCCNIKTLWTVCNSKWAVMQILSILANSQSRVNKGNSRHSAWFQWLGLSRSLSRLGLVPTSFQNQLLWRHEPHRSLIGSWTLPADSSLRAGSYHDLQIFARPVTHTRSPRTHLSLRERNPGNTHLIILIFLMFILCVQSIHGLLLWLIHGKDKLRCFSPCNMDCGDSLLIYRGSMPYKYEPFSECNLT